MRGPSVALLFTLLLASGCATPRPTGSMSQETVDRLGRKDFYAARADVHQATLGALRALGYPVVSSDPNQGQIHTGRRAIRIGNSRTYSGHAWGTPLVGGEPGAPRVEREYWIAIQEVSPTQSTVIASPYLFANGENVSGQSIWDLEAEKRAWSRLFHEIRIRLRELPAWNPVSPMVPAYPGSGEGFGTPPPPPGDGSYVPPPPDSGSTARVPQAPDDGPAPPPPAPAPSPSNDQPPMPPPPEPIESTPPPPPSTSSEPQGGSPSADPSSDYSNPFAKPH